MWRFHRRDESRPEPARRVVVVRPDFAALTGWTAAELAARVRAAAADEDVVIDLSAIEEWDSAGASMVSELVESPARRVWVEGLAEATERMLGTSVPPPHLAATDEPDPAQLTWLRTTAVFRPRNAAEFVERLEPVVANLPGAISTVVLDLSDIAELDAATVDAVAFASSLAAVRTKRLLVVNVPPADVERLRTAGLSERTWVSPPPLD